MLWVGLHERRRDSGESIHAFGGGDRTGDVTRVV